MALAAQLALTIGAWVLLVLLLTGGVWFLRQHQLLHTPLILILLCLGIFLPAGTDRWRAVGRDAPGRVGEPGHRRHEPCGPLWRGGDGLGEVAEERSGLRRNSLSLLVRRRSPAIRWTSPARDRPEQHPGRARLTPWKYATGSRRRAPRLIPGVRGRPGISWTECRSSISRAPWDRPRSVPSSRGTGS
jgi:hypothetical protein